MAIGRKSFKKDRHIYLGVIINRNLTDTNHIKGHLDNKASKGAAYTRFTLTRHSDINRIDFGNTLWNNAVLPSLSHACGIWFTNTKTSRSILHSAQYKCAKAVLKLHSKPSAVATIAELGWLPIDAELDIQRINYFQHLKKMENTRITKMVFNELQELHFSHIDTPFKYFKNMKVIFEKYGLDQLFNRDAFPVKETKYFVYEKCALEMIDYIPKKTSLKRFTKFQEKCSSYLLTKASFSSIQLKFKMRTGVLGLGEDLARQHRGTGMCDLCGTFETAKHFTLHCPLYSTERQYMFKSIQDFTGNDVFGAIMSSPNTFMFLLLGEHDNIFNSVFIDFISKAWNKRLESF